MFRKLKEPGLQVAYEIEKLPEEKIPKQILIHTHNTYRGYIMLDILKRLTPTQYIPFSNLLSATMKM